MIRSTAICMAAALGVFFALPPLHTASEQSVRASYLAPSAPLVVTPIHPLPPDPEDKWALVIGIGKFQGNTSPNPGSAGDALDVKELLVRNGWREDRIRLLTDADATGSAIRSGLQWLTDHCDQRSLCVFHYSGHAKQFSATHEALWSHDNIFIDDRETDGYLRRLPNAWINVSSCEAAGFDKGVSGPTRLFTASSKESEKSYEHPVWKNSIFTGLLVKQGSLQGLADANHDGRVTRQEAFEFAATRAPDITRLQSRGPQHPYLAGGGDGDWLLPGTGSATPAPVDPSAPLDSGDASGTAVSPRTSLATPPPSAAPRSPENNSVSASVVSMDGQSANHRRCNLGFACRPPDIANRQT